MEIEANGVNDSSDVPALIICRLKIPGICYPAMDKVKQFLQQRHRGTLIFLTFLYNIYAFAVITAM